MDLAPYLLPVALPAVITHLTPHSIIGLAHKEDRCHPMGRGTAFGRGRDTNIETDLFHVEEAAKGQKLVAAVAAWGSSPTKKKKRSVL